MFKHLSPTTTVLVVNDRTDQQVLTDLLKTNGCCVLEESGIQGAIDSVLDFTWTKRPDLILVDLDSALTEHPLAVRIMKSSGELKNVPIIAIGYSNKDNFKSKAIAIGFDDFVVNPINKDQVQKLLGYLTPQRVRAA